VVAPPAEHLLGCVEQLVATEVLVLATPLFAPSGRARRRHRRTVT
jgi:hypothetical protein